MKLRAAASALLAGAVLTILAGCGLITPVATQFSYAPSDGVQGTVGRVDILNALAITGAESSDANLLFAAYNGAEEAVTLSVQYEAAGARTTLEFELAPGSVTNIGYSETGLLTLPGVDAIAGGLLPVYFQYGAEQGVQLDVPVLDGTLEQYADYVPGDAPVIEVPCEDCAAEDEPESEPAEEAEAH